MNQDTLYKKIWEICEDTNTPIGFAEHLVMTVNNWLPPQRVENKYDADYNAGWNDCLDMIKQNLK